MTTYYVGYSGASDANDGLSTTTSLATPDAAVALLADGDSIEILGNGAVYTGASATLTITNNNITIRGRGYYRPILSALQTITGTWTNTGSNVWKIALAYDPLNVFFWSASGTFQGQTGTPTKGIEEASAAACNAAAEWYWAAGELFVYSTSDPATAFAKVQVHPSASGDGILCTGNGLTVQGIALWGQRGSSIVVNNADSPTVDDCHLAFFSEDGYGGTDVNDPVMRYSRVEYGGQTKGTIASPGDGVSWHGTTRRFVVYKSEFLHMSKAAVDSIQDSDGTVYGCYINDCYTNMLAFQNAGVVQTFACNIVETAYGASSWNPTVHDAGCFSISNGTARLFHNTFYGAGTSGTHPSGIVIVDAGATGTIQAFNNIVTNLQYGILSLAAGITWTETNNNFGGNGTAQFGHALHGSDQTSAPLLVSPGGASGNYRLQSGSPCRGAGVTPNIVTYPTSPFYDFQEQLFPATRDIGAMRYVTPSAGGFWG